MVLDRGGPVRVRRAALATAGALLGLLTLSGPAAATAQVDRAAAQAERDAASADAVAAVAAREVEALTVRYVRASAAVQQGVEALAVSFTAGTAADRDLKEAATSLARARTDRARRVRALYSGGGSVMLAASLLSASSPQDVLWRASTARRVLADLALAAQDDVAQRQDALAAAVGRQASSSRADDERVDILETLEVDAVAAEALLAQAKAVLQELDARARQAEATARAARRLAQAEAAAAAARRTAAAGVSALGIPVEFEAAYRAAATTCPGLRWTLLAAVGQVESGHGRTNGPSSAGAVGPMQFMPRTFDAYGVDGDGDGVADPWDPQDAVWSAARYLCASGAGTPDGDQSALFAYNRAQWYVDLVLATERAVLGQPAAVAPGPAGVTAP